MANTRTEAGGNLGLMLGTDDVVFTHANTSEFEFINMLNARPLSSFSLIDSQSSFMRTRSLGLFSVYFTNTTDDITAKASGISGIIDDISNKNTISGSSEFDIEWSAGNIEQLKVETNAWNGSSVDILSEIFNNRQTGHQNKAIGNVDVADNMWWRSAQNDMWEDLDACVSHSHIRDDYLFWVWDDVNGTYKVSTFNLEMAQEDRYVLIEGNVADSSTPAGIAHYDNPKLSAWSFSKHIKKNELGINRDKLFPNLYIEGDGGTGKSIAVNKGCFSSVLADMGDTSKETISEATDIEDPLTTFGPRKVTRHWPNNTHKFYSLAEMYRQYKLATYGKVMYIQLHNQVGPPMGSKVSVLTAGNDFKVRGMNMDRFFSDKYIVAEKKFNWSTTTLDGMYNEKPTTGKWTTTIKLISNNVNDGDTAHIESLIKSMGR